MANVDRPFGLRPVKHLNGSPWNGQTQLCYIPSTDSTRAFFIGDPVVRAGSANADGTCPSVTIATMGDANPIYGVITGFLPDSSYLNQTYRSDDTERYCFVCCDPDVIFEVQDDGAAVIGIAGVGLNANLISTHSGSTVTGYSGIELQADTVAGDASYQLVILNAAPLPDNDATLARAVWQVLISQHQLRYAIATGGILGS